MRYTFKEDKFLSDNYNYTFLHISIENFEKNNINSDIDEIYNLILNFFLKEKYNFFEKYKKNDSGVVFVNILLPKDLSYFFYSHFKFIKNEFKKIDTNIKTWINGNFVFLSFS